MKKTALTALFAIIVTINAHTQGTIAFDNQFNTNVTLINAPAAAVCLGKVFLTQATGTFRSWVAAPQATYLLLPPFCKATV